MQVLRPDSCSWRLELSEMDSHRSSAKHHLEKSEKVPTYEQARTHALVAIAHAVMDLTEEVHELRKKVGK